MTVGPDRRPMAEARRYLAGLGLPDRDLGELPTSARRFADGAQYRVEIPSVEGTGPVPGGPGERRGGCGSTASARAAGCCC